MVPEIFPLCLLAGLKQSGCRLVWICQNLVADLGVGDGAVFLSQVKPQLALMTEVQVTFLTAVGLLAGVYAQVALQRLQVPEAGPAGVTRVRLLSSVDQNMGTQVSYLDKSGSACVTAVRLFSRVNAGMSL